MGERKCSYFIPPIILGFGFNVIAEQVIQGKTYSKADVIMFFSVLEADRL